MPLLQKPCSRRVRRPLKKHQVTAKEAPSKCDKSNSVCGQRPARGKYWIHADSPPRGLLTKLPTTKRSGHWGQETAVDGFRSRAGILDLSGGDHNIFFRCERLERWSVRYPKLARHCVVSWGCGLLPGAYGDSMGIQRRRGQLDRHVHRDCRSDDYKRDHRDLALHMQSSHSDNSDRLALLIRWFRFATVLLALEILLWVVSYAPWS